MACWTPTNVGRILNFEISVFGSLEALPVHTSPSFLKLDCARNIPDHRESIYLKALAAFQCTRTWEGPRGLSKWQGEFKEKL